MPDLFADRFVAIGRSWIDIASGARVRLHLGELASVSEQIVWNDRCAERALLRHPLLNPLVDFGLIDKSRAFEAYGAGEPLEMAAAAAARLLRHATRFLQSRGLPLSAETARFATRDIINIARVRAERGAARTRTAAMTPIPGRMRLAVGIVLQQRSVLAQLADALDGASRGGTVSIEISGGCGSGLRTSRLLAARIARLSGLVPVCSTMLLRLPWLRERLDKRHLCVLLDDHGAGERTALAAFLARLGVTSARRHVLLRFTRTETPSAGAYPLDRMGIAAMTSMVFADDSEGPLADELFDAARGAAGRPGLFLERLRAVHIADVPPRIALLHESSPAYVLSEPRPPLPARGVNRILRDAAERGTRLAARGRHAAAIRLLTRASKVLEARGERGLASACVESLAWIYRTRGQSTQALEQFHRVRELSRAGDARAVAAVIGIGVVWTDLRKFADAEAALRSACASTDLLDDGELKLAARRALGRCLYWQERHDEAIVVFQDSAFAGEISAGAVECAAMLARARAATSDVRAARGAAGDAMRRLPAVTDLRVRAAVCRHLATVHRATGDVEQQREWSEQALHAALLAHLPLAALRARGLLLAATTSGGPRSVADSSRADGHRHRWIVHLETALAKRSLPDLVRSEIEQVTNPRSIAHATATSSDRALLDLERVLQVAQAASDDGGAIDAVCGIVLDRLRASGVQVVAGTQEPRVLARAGRPWPMDLVLLLRATAAKRSVPARPGQHESAIVGEAIRVGEEAVAVLCCRWTIGTAIEWDHASGLLRAAALVLSAPVRALLEAPAVGPPDDAFNDLIGSSEAAVALRAAIYRASRAPYPVLIEGESGSGKELVARGVHRLGARRDRRLCTVNCAALTDDLLEAELFGHARGAFTGAVGERAGLFEEADGGTIFLDEIGELSARAQAKLLRVLQDGEVRRVGENMPRRVDARVVAATNRRLEEEVSASRFRADLRFRLDVIRIAVPPLRERASDIPQLAARFWTDAAGRVGTAATLAAETLSALARYDWPGNIRELQNVVASLAVHAPRRGRLLPSVLPPHIARGAATGATTFEAARHEFERRYVRAALAQAGGQRARAARTLGVSRQGLAKMLRRLRIDEVLR